jgi:hypothetical protein
MPTSLQCCSVGECTAAVIVVFEGAIKRYNLEANRAIRITSSVGRREQPAMASNADATLTREAITSARVESQISAKQLNVLEFQDAFAIEGLQHANASGWCAEGSAIHAPEADVRQQPNAGIGLAHRVGLGSVWYAHVLQRE